MLVHRDRPIRHGPLNRINLVIDLVRARNVLRRAVGLELKLGEQSPATCLCTLHLLLQYILQLLGLFNPHTERNDRSLLQLLKSGFMLGRELTQRINDQ